jgi:hypothetical protein
MQGVGNRVLSEHAMQKAMQHSLTYTAQTFPFFLVELLSSLHINNELAVHHRRYVAMLSVPEGAKSSIIEASASIKRM